MQLIEILIECLNSPDPQGTLVEKLNSGKLSKVQQNKLQQLFDKAIHDAQKQHIPMGVELLDCLSDEDAYLLRQRFLSKLYQKYDQGHTLNQLAFSGIAILVITLIFWFVV